jgi:hypothetical protein
MTKVAQRSHALARNRWPCEQYNVWVMEDGSFNGSTRAMPKIYWGGAPRHPHRHRTMAKRGDAICFFWVAPAKDIGHSLFWTLGLIKCNLWLALSTRKIGPYPKIIYFYCNFLVLELSHRTNDIHKYLCGYTFISKVVLHTNYFTSSFGLTPTLVTETRYNRSPTLVDITVRQS